MLFEKNTLVGLLVPWFTGCSAVSPGQLPLCARASISVPGAPASSLVTGSQVLVLNPGVEICAPVWVATALLCTVQPMVPRLEMSLAPVPDGAFRLVAARGAGAAARPGAGAAGRVCAEAFAEALGTSQASVVAAIAAAAQGTERARRIRRITGHSCHAAVTTIDGRPGLNSQLVRNLSKQTCQGLGFVRVCRGPVVARGSAAVPPT